MYCRIHWCDEREEAVPSISVPFMKTHSRTLLSGLGGEQLL